MKLFLLFLILATSLNEIVLASESCSGRCGETNNSPGCQCITSCKDFGDCCSDYSSVCYSCVDRCNEPFKKSKPCQCNDGCQNYQNCCNDYTSVCQKGEITDADIISLSEELYRLDQDFLSGDLVRYDPTPPGPFFTYVDPKVFTFPTISSFLPLRDNYDPYTYTGEYDDSQELAEIKVFMDAIMDTDVMRKTEKFMRDNDLISRSLRSEIQEIFFTRYPRDKNTLGSSGFEHSFMGEIDGGKVKGFHNWISFYKEEQNGNLQFYQDRKDEQIAADLDLRALAYDWMDYPKSFGSMLIGSTPELELAIYTLCFHYAPNDYCNVSMNGVKFRIKSYVQRYNGKDLVGTAYPDFY